MAAQLVPRPWFVGCRKIVEFDDEVPLVDDADDRRWTDGGRQRSVQSFQLPAFAELVLDNRRLILHHQHHHYHHHHRRLMSSSYVVRRHCRRRTSYDVIVDVVRRHCRRRTTSLCRRRTSYDVIVDVIVDVLRRTPSLSSSYVGPVRAPGL